MRHQKHNEILVCPVCKVEFSANVISKRTYCGRSCYSAANTLPVEVRFHSYLGPETPNGCIPWIGLTNPAGYGLFSNKNDAGKWRMGLAHRMAWKLANGNLEENIHVLHRCDNPTCVNPDHLFLGTAAENMADKVSKDRHPRGEGCSYAKLSDDQIREIRSSYSAGGISQSELGDEFGVSQSMIWMIVNQKRWTHLK